MKKSMFIALSMLCIVSALVIPDVCDQAQAGKPAAADKSAAASQDAAVRVPLESYIKGQATVSGEYMKKAFHPSARIMGMHDGKLVEFTLDEFVSRFDGKVAADEAQRKRRITSVQVTGNAAVATLELDYPTVRIIDHMSLLEIDGEWKIVNKIFYAQPKAPK